MKLSTLVSYTMVVAIVVTEHKQNEKTKGRCE